jgi:putative MATE family efflux protein
MIFGNVEPEVMDAAVIYFQITALSYPFIAIYNSCAALFRSMGNAKISMFVSLVMNVVNIVGNTICVYGLHMGVEGVAYPTLISRIVAAVMMFYLIQNPDNVVRIRRLSELKPDFKMIKNILVVGIPNGLENGMFQFGKIALQSLVSSLGTAAIASYAVASNLVTLLYLPGNAIGLGLITIVGQCVGAGEIKQVKYYSRLLVGINYGILLVLCTVMVLFSDQLVSIYNLSPQAAQISAQMIVVHCFAMIVWPISFTVPYALRASMDAKFTMMVSVFSMWLFRIGTSYLFVQVMNLGVMGIWYGMFIDWFFRAVIFALRFRGIEKRAVSVS